MACLYGGDSPGAATGVLWHVSMEVIVLVLLQGFCGMSLGR